MTEKPKRRRGKRNSEVFSQCDRDFQQYDKVFNHGVAECEQWLKQRLEQVYRAAYDSGSWQVAVEELEGLMKEVS